MNRVVAISLCALALLAVRLPAQQVESLPGFVDFERFGHFDPDHLMVEINLSGALLSMLGTALEEEDGDFAELLRSLELVKVHIFEAESVEVGRERLAPTIRRLRSDGWEAVVSIRTDENLHILLRTDDDRIEGVLAAFSGHNSFGLVNIVGEFDPEQIGRLARQLDIEPLEELDLSGRIRNDHDH